MVKSMLIRLTPNPMSELANIGNERAVGRVVSQFSCGAASACATKLALEKHGAAVHVINAFVADEDEDNLDESRAWFEAHSRVLLAQRDTILTATANLRQMRIQLAERVTDGQEALVVMTKRVAECEALVASLAVCITEQHNVRIEAALKGE